MSLNLILNIYKIPCAIIEINVNKMYEKRCSIKLRRIKKIYINK